ncbi:4-hydroxy-2-oxovalerate aldolase [Neobacillus pocheonensis]|uniref:4-hydroxy-2-oxovalerate aldolase n=1 Tax=Neobacillus pocheonensis TaxID=363869 RepID=A0ABT0WEE2_9BACI|nr:4-hydroxy-2-oxovalerate aldolase [Neobacillus pocheonensis]
MGIDLRIDIYKMIDVAEDIVKPLMPRSQEIGRGSLVMGYAGVYSSFLLHAERASERFCLDSRNILLELGKRKVVGGQEDMFLDVAAEMAKDKKEGVQS